MYWAIILIIILLFALVFMSNTNKQTEHFQWDTNWVGKTSLDCYGEKIKDCNKYSNCGLCAQNGNRKCVPGDEQGPFFTENCDLWEYTNYYDRHIFGEKVHTTSAPWNRAYSDYEIWYPSPVARSALQGY